MIFGLALNKILWPLVGVVAVIAVVIGIWENVPGIGPRARVEHQRELVMKWRGAYEEWRSYGKAERAAFLESERLRKAEAEVARGALQSAEKSCGVRLAEARRSAAAIRSIVTQEPSHDAQGCPVRGVVPPNQLRDALQPSRSR